MGMGERGEKLVNFNSFLNLILSRLDESRASHLQPLFCFSVPLPQMHFALSYPALLSLSNLLSYLSRPCLTQHLAKFQLLFPLDDLFSSVSWVITAIIQNMDSLGSSPAAHCFCPVSFSAFSPCTAVVPSCAWLWALSLSFCSRVTCGLLWGCQGQALDLQTEPSRKEHCLHLCSYHQTYLLHNKHKLQNLTSLVYFGSNCL